MASKRLVSPPSPPAGNSLLAPSTFAPAALLLCAALAAAGCWYHVEENCPSCTVVDHVRTEIPPTAPFTHTEVVLVHGSFGFGDEWREVVDTVRQTPGFDLIAWTWPGPFRNPPRDALALRAELQALLDGLPPTVEEIIVLAHSAGGLITNLAVRDLRVPPGRHVTVAFLDATFWPKLEKPEKYPPLPPGVTGAVFFAKDPPGKAAPKGTPRGADGTDMPWEYVGAVGHDPMVAKASLPILMARRDAKRARPTSGLPPSDLGGSQTNPPSTPFSPKSGGSGGPGGQ